MRNRYTTTATCQCTTTCRSTTTTTTTCQSNSSTTSFGHSVCDFANTCSCLRRLWWITFCAFA